MNRGLPPRASLTSERQVWLNRSALALLGGARVVTLHYERATGRIGLRPAAAGVHNGYAVRIGHGGAYVTAMAFCRYFGVTAPTRALPYAVTAENGALVLTPEPAPPEEA